MKRIVDYDPTTGASTWFEYHPETDMTIVSRMQDVEPLLDMNKRLANNDDYTKTGIKKEWWHYASIPNVIIEKWLNEDGIDVFNKEDGKRVYKKLNDPEYRYLKTTAKFHW
jgi:hypothetical protein